MGSMLLSAEVTAIDFSTELTAALNGVKADYIKYAGIAIGIGFAIWAAPKAIQLVKKFFNSLIR